MGQFLMWPNTILSEFECIPASEDFWRSNVMKANRVKLEYGSLWTKTHDRTERALRISALVHISTESTFLHEGSVDFQVRIVSNLARKVEEKRPNPFLPYDEDLFVADISDTHVCLLNKFNVIDHHLLIVTRLFEDQETLLTMQDFEAILVCMSEFEGLAFYNGGEVAGASQQHKHLQMIPLPMVENGLHVPIEPLFAGARFDRELGVIPGFHFAHSFARLEPGLVKQHSKAVAVVFRLYRDMLQEVGLNFSDGPEHDRQFGPYNLLLTREWMFLVPRSKECFESISINALGFAGALLVQNKQQIEMLKKHGVMAALKHIAIAD